MGTDGATITQTVGGYAAATIGSEPITTSLSATNFAPTGTTSLANYLLPTGASGVGTITAIVSVPPTATLTPSTQVFTSVTGSPSAVQTAVLTNTGTASLVITSITLSGADASAFLATNSCGSTLASGRDVHDLDHLYANVAEKLYCCVECRRQRYGLTANDKPDRYAYRSGWLYIAIGDHYTNRNAGSDGELLYRCGAAERYFPWTGSAKCQWPAERSDRDLYACFRHSGQLLRNLNSERSGSSDASYGG